MNKKRKAFKEPEEIKNANEVFAEESRKLLEKKHCRALVKLGTLSLAAVIAGTPLSVLADTERETTANLRIRSEPTVSSTQVGLLQKGVHVVTKDEVILNDNLAWCPLRDGSGFICIDYTKVINTPKVVDTSIIEGYLIDYDNAITEVESIRSSISNKTLKSLCDQATEYVIYARKSIIDCNISKGKSTHYDNFVDLYSTVYAYSTKKHTFKNKNAVQKLLDTLFDLPKILMTEMEIVDHYRTGKIYAWNQSDQRWVEIAPNLPIKLYGCALTSICVQLARANLVTVDETSNIYNTETREGFNVASFAKEWRNVGGLGSDTSVTWDSVQKLIPEFVVTVDTTYHSAPGAFSYFPCGTREEVVAAFDYWINDCNLFPIIELPGSRGLSSTHFCAVVGADVENNDVYIADSATGTVRSLFERNSLYEIDYHGNPPSYGSCVLYEVKE